MNTTFIIPIRVESPDRARNVRASVRYLLKNTDSLIILKEVDGKASIPEILKDELKSERIKYLFEENAGAFHRTRYLNDMIQLCSTFVVCNYDVDVVLHPAAYKVCEDVIINGQADVIYPFPESDTGQLKLWFTPESEESFLENSEYESLKGSNVQLWRAHAGFCFFASKEAYIRAGAEIESFISWGPEDGERLSRFLKMGLRVGRLDSQVIHMEHCRSPDSDDRNHHYDNNLQLFNMLTDMTPEAMSLHLDSQEYLLRRGWRTKT